MSAISEMGDWLQQMTRKIHQDYAPLIAALQAQIDSCEAGTKCKVCNQARQALQEFHSKYPKLQDVK